MRLMVKSDIISLSRSPGCGRIFLPHDNTYNHISC